MRLCVVSNSGGSGKSTLSTLLAYELSTRKKIKTALLDLDQQGTLTLFTGTTKVPYEQTLGGVLCENFKGEWPLQRCWPEHSVEVDLCPGGKGLIRTARELELHGRGAYLLADRLEDYPLPHQLIIFDCPATLGPLPKAAIAACTHIIVPVLLEPKSIWGAAQLLGWLYNTVKELRLKPSPEIIGFVPISYDRSKAGQRHTLEQLPVELSKFGIEVFPPLRHTAEIVNSSGCGLPLRLYRPAHPANKDLEKVNRVLAELLEETNS